MTDTPAPQSIEQFFARRAGPVAPDRAGPGFPGLDGVPSGGGQHRNAMLQLTSFFRRTMMLTSERAAAMAKAAIDAGLLENYNAADPFTLEELETMAMRVPPGYQVSADPEYGEIQETPQLDDSDGPTLTTLADSIVGTVDELETFEKPLEWLIYGYVPKHALTMLYGDGSVGKSTLGAYVAGKALALGINVLFVGAGEERPGRFYARARASMSGAEVRGSFGFLKMPDFRLPGGGVALRSAIVDKNIGFIYFDAWRAHIDHSVEGHEADMTRTVLNPLAELAAAHRVGILCTTHENAAGRMMGSTEVRNVARVALHLTKDSQGIRHLKVAKTDGPDPKGTLRFAIESTQLRDHRGTVQTEVTESGEIKPVEYGYVRTHEISEFESFSVDAGITTDQERIAAAIRRRREENPHVTQRECINRISGPVTLREALFQRDCLEYPPPAEAGGL